MRRNRLRDVPKEQLETLIKESTTFIEVLRKLDWQKPGGSTKVLLKKLANEYGISYAHIIVGKGHNKYKINPTNRPPVISYLKTNSSIDGNSLKKRLIKEGYLKNECVKCGVGDKWNGEHLVLTMDHINGISNDNRLENLRILCPNCHSQTPTFAGRNNKYKYCGDGVAGNPT